MPSRARPSFWRLRPLGPVLVRAAARARAQQPPAATVTSRGRDLSVRAAAAGASRSLSFERGRARESETERDRLCDRRRRLSLSEGGADSVFFYWLIVCSIGASHIHLCMSLGVSG
jgi:hypothetical protein